MAVSPRRALIAIDVQNEYVTGQLPIEFPPVQTSLANIGRAMDAAKEAGVPVVVVQHDAPATSPVFAKGSEAWKLHTTVASRPADHFISKTTANAFAGTNLAQWLAENRIDTISVAGYMTHNCDAATIYHACGAGLKVEFLADASGALPYRNEGGKVSAEEVHRVFCTVFHSNFASVATTDTWIAALREGRAIERDNVFVSNHRARADVGT